MSAISPIIERFPTARELHEALEIFWGSGAWFRWGVDPRVSFAACPGCKSKPLRRVALCEGYPWTIEELAGGDYLLAQHCWCREESIVRALDGAALSRAMRGAA